jgi:hypothetical protein
MASLPVSFPSHLIEPRAKIYGPIVATIAEITQGGRPLVRFEGTNAPVVARIGTAWEAADGCTVGIGTQVVIIFENGDRALPIITGFLRNSLAASKNSAEVANDGGGFARSFNLQGQKISLEGTEEIVLRCGLGSLTIRADGQVIIKGTRLMSKASETNKIRGSSVLVN